MMSWLTDALSSVEKLLIGQRTGSQWLFQHRRETIASSSRQLDNSEKGSDIPCSRYAFDQCRLNVRWCKALARTNDPSLVRRRAHGDHFTRLYWSTHGGRPKLGLHKMRQVAADPALRSSITTDAAVDECLFAPTTVVRQAKTPGEVGGCTFRRGSLFILGLGSASKGAANRDLVFQ